MPDRDACNRDKALATALDLTRAELAGADIASRCPGLRLPAPVDDILEIVFFERTYRLDLRGLAFSPEADPVRQILMLRYLRHAELLSEEGDPVAFREMPGASFYVNPFKARTVTPLAAKIGDNLWDLSAPMAACSARPTCRGDASWRVKAIGAIWLELICYAPDEEFQASCELLFSPAVPRVYSADEAAMLGSLFCAYLMRGL